MKKIALVTGATSGIGKASAILLAKNAYDIIATGRRQERLDQLKEEILSNGGSDVLDLAFDVRNLNEVKNSIAKIKGKWKNIDVLINNAGLSAGLNSIEEGEFDDWEVMIDTNIKGLLYMTRLICPMMIERGKGGHIINIGSIAGREVYANGNVYCATKYAVKALSQGMRIDLLKHNIKVTNIEPGMVETEFSEVRFKGDKKKAAEVYKGLTPLYAEDIAEAVLFAVTRPAHVCINDMLIMPTAQARFHYVKRNQNN